MYIPSFSLDDRVAVVTGGRRGIGKAIALALAGAGADVVVCDNVLEGGELEATAKEIQGIGRHSLAVKLDVSKKADIDNMVQQVVGKFGKIDVLANCAGILLRKAMLDTTEEDWDRVLDINLKGTFLCSQAVSRVMIERKKGSIILIASDMAFFGRPNTVAYNVSKAGVAMIAKVFARELGSYNIRTNGIAPSFTKTEMSRLSWTNPERLKMFESAAPLGRVAVPEDYTGIAVFLASDASSYITGHTILVDGGSTT